MAISLRELQSNLSLKDSASSAAGITRCLNIYVKEKANTYLLHS